MRKDKRNGMIPSQKTPFRIYNVYLSLCCSIEVSEWMTRKTPSLSMKTIIDLYGTIQFFSRHDSFIRHLLAKLDKSIDLLVVNPLNVLDKT